MRDILIILGQIGWPWLGFVLFLWGIKKRPRLTLALGVFTSTVFLFWYLP